MFERSAVELPALLAGGLGGNVLAKADWSARRAGLLQQILEIEYGELPPVAQRVRARLLHEHSTSSTGRYNNARHAQYHLICEGGRQPVAFVLDLLVPAGDGPFPVILDGDGCWLYVADEVRREVTGRGYILAVFNRTEIAPDNGSPARDCGIYEAYPEGEYGAIAAWAWGYHRCVDFLARLDFVDSTRIAVTGHSRGGKTALLAGATDERIALTAPNNSGCCGAGCFRICGAGSERIADILRNFSYWFSPNLLAYAGRDEELPFDQHALKALIAPRALITTEALGDLWANPYGTYQTHLAAQEVYQLLGASGKIAIKFREGGHAHEYRDWVTLLDFADQHLHIPVCFPFAEG